MAFPTRRWIVLALLLVLGCTGGSEDPATPATSGAPGSTATGSAPDDEGPRDWRRVGLGSDAPEGAVFVPLSIEGTSVGWFLVGSGSPAIGAVRGAEVWASDDGTAWRQEVVVPLDDRDAEILDVDDGDGTVLAAGRAGGWIDAQPVVWRREGGQWIDPVVLPGAEPSTIAASIARTPIGWVAVGSPADLRLGAAAHVWVSTDGASWQRVEGLDAGAGRREMLLVDQPIVTSGGVAIPMVRAEPDLAGPVGGELVIGDSAGWRVENWPLDDVHDGVDLGADLLISGYAELAVRADDGVATRWEPLGWPAITDLYTTDVLVVGGRLVIGQLVDGDVRIVATRAGVPLERDAISDPGSWEPVGLPEALEGPPDLAQSSDIGSSIRMGTDGEALAITAPTRRAQRVWTSTPESEWIESDTSAIPQLRRDFFTEVQDVAADGQTVVAVGRRTVRDPESGSDVRARVATMWASTDAGESWVSVEPPDGVERLEGVVAWEDGFVAVGGADGAAVLRSEDGAAWTVLDTSGLDRSSDVATAVERVADRLVMSVEGKSGTTLWWSTDGETWEEADEGPEPGSEVRDICSDGSTAFLVGAVGGGPLVWSTTDGTEWVDEEVESRSDANTRVSSCAVGTDRVVAVGTSGWDVTEDEARGWSRELDGTDWGELAIDSDPAQRFNGTYASSVVWTGRGFLASGATGRRDPSADPIYWTSDDGEGWAPLDAVDPMVSEQGAGEGSAVVALRDRVILTGWEDDAAFALVGPIPG